MTSEEEVIAHYRGKVAAGWWPTYDDDGRLDEQGGSFYRAVVPANADVELAIMLACPDVDGSFNQYPVANMNHQGKWCVA